MSKFEFDNICNDDTSLKNFDSIIDDSDDNFDSIVDDMLDNLSDYSKAKSGSNSGKTSGKTSRGSGKTSDSREKFHNGVGRTRRKRSVKKAGVIVGVIAVAIMIFLGFGALRLWNNPARMIKEYLDQQNYAKAVEFYNSDVYGHKEREEQIDDTLKEQIMTFRKDYEKEELLPDEAIEYLNTFSGIQKEELSGLSQSEMEYISQHEEYKQFFFEGEELQAAEDYLGAMKLYASIPEEDSLFSDAHERYTECMDALLFEIKYPKTEEDYQNYMSTVLGYMEQFPDESAFRERYLQLNDESQDLAACARRDEILKLADTAFQSGDYKTAFDTLKEGIDQLPESSELSDRLNVYQSEYIKVITDKVNAFLAQKDYDSAMNEINAAIGIYSCQEFETLKESAYNQKETMLVSYDAKAVEFVRETGSINSDESVNRYTLHAEREGVYCLTFSEMQYEFWVNVKILNDLNETVAKKNVSNNDTVSTEVIPQGEYTIEISYSYGTGSYEFTVGHQKESVDINSFGTINDSVEYQDQVNNYEFVPDETGLYRFDFSDMMYDTEITFTIYDHLNTPVKKAGVRSKQGLTVDGLTAGEKYKISISQASGLTQYTINIGRQRAVRSIETGQKISDSIQFVDQRNLYTFVPDETRIYTITGNKSDWDEWYLKAYDENNTPLKLKNTGDQQVFLELEAGEKYTISCYYREKFIEYSFSIN